MFSLRPSTVVNFFLSVGVLISWGWFFGKYRRNQEPMPFPPMEMPLGIVAMQGYPDTGKDDFWFSIQLCEPSPDNSANDMPASPDSPDSPWITFIPGRDDPRPEGVASQRMIRWVIPWAMAARDDIALSWPVVGRVTTGSREHPVQMDLLYKAGTPPTPGQVAFRWQGQTYLMPPGPEADLCAEEIAAPLAPPLH